MTTHKLWIPSYDSRVRSTHISPAQVNRSIALRKTMRHDGMIEQFTETLPRRWWQLKAPTRIRIRRVRESVFINCSFVNSDRYGVKV